MQEVDEENERDCYYGSEEKRLREEFERLSGHAWERTEKTVADAE